MVEVVLHKWVSKGLAFREGQPHIEGPSLNLSLGHALFGPLLKPGQDVDDFLEAELRSTPTVCGKVFNNGDPVFQCMDCGVDTTCVLCAQCFRSSEHRKHRYNMSTSSGGGCCDCGDPEAWTQHHCCSIHDPTVSEADSHGHGHSKEVTEFLEATAPAFFAELIGWVVKVLTSLEATSSWIEGSAHSTVIGSASSKHCVVLVNDETHSFDQVINQVRKAAHIGLELAINITTAVDAKGRAVLFVGENELEVCETMVTVLAEIDLNASVVNMSCFAAQEAALEAIRWMTDLGVLSNMIRRMLCVALAGAIPPGGWISGDDATAAASLAASEESGDFPLDAFLLHFVELWKEARQLVRSLLFSTMLLEQDFKPPFAATFVKHYEHVQMSRTDDDQEKETETLTSVSVQLFTVPTLARWLVTKHDALNVLLRYLIKLFSEVEVDDGGSTTLDCDRNDKMFGGERADYITVMYDLGYLLGCGVGNVTSALPLFLDLLNRMQGMDPVARQLGNHIEIESNAWQNAISLTYHVLTTIFSKFVDSTSATAADVFEAINLTLDTMEHGISMPHMLHVVNGGTEVIKFHVHAAERVSIHCPLHRFLARLILRSVVHGGHKLHELLQVAPPAGGGVNARKVMALMEHPLQAVVLASQVASTNVWIRNGHSLQSSIFNYHRTKTIGMHTMDVDVVMLQIGAALMDPAHFSSVLLDRFEASAWLLPEFESLFLQRAITSGDVVEVFGLVKKPALNGARGQVLQRVLGEGGHVRWVVDLQGSGKLKLKPTNLRAVHGNSGASADGEFEQAGGDSRSIADVGMAAAAESAMQSAASKHICLMADVQVDASTYPKLVEGLLDTLVHVITERHKEGIGQVSFRDIVRREVLQQLCLSPMAHSSFKKRMHSSMVKAKEFEEVLKEISDFRQQSAVFELKEECLAEYNPNFYHFQPTERIKAESAIYERTRGSLPSTPAPVAFVAAFEPVYSVARSHPVLLLLHTIFCRAGGGWVITASHPDQGEWGTKCRCLVTERLVQSALHLVGMSLQEPAPGVALQYAAALTSFAENGVSLINALVRLGQCPGWAMPTGQSKFASALRFIFMLLRSDAFEGNASIKLAVENAAGPEGTAGNAMDAEVGGGSAGQQSVRLAKQKKQASVRRAFVISKFAAMQKAFIKTLPPALQRKLEIENSSTSPLSPTSILGGAATPSKRKADDGSLVSERAQPGGAGGSAASTALSEGPDAYAAASSTNDGGAGPADDLDMPTADESQRCINCDDVCTGLSLLSYAQQSTVLSPNQAASSDIHLESCGHAMCTACHAAFIKERVLQIRREARYQAPVELWRQDSSNNIILRDFFCPLCNTLCNCLIPIVSAEVRNSTGRAAKSRRSSGSGGSEAACNGNGVASSFTLIRKAAGAASKTNAEKDGNASGGAALSAAAAAASSAMPAGTARDVVGSDDHDGAVTAKEKLGAKGKASASGAIDALRRTIREAHDKVISVASPPAQFAAFMPAQARSSDLDLSNKYLACTIATLSVTCKDMKVPYGSAALLSVLLDMNRKGQATDAYGSGEAASCAMTAIKALGRDAAIAGGAHGVRLALQRDPFELFLEVAMAFADDHANGLVLAKAAGRLCLGVTIVQALVAFANDAGGATSAGKRKARNAGAAKTDTASGDGGGGGSGDAAAAGMDMGAASAPPPRASTAPSDSLPVSAADAAFIYKVNDIVCSLLGFDAAAAVVGANAGSTTIAAAMSAAQVYLRQVALFLQAHSFDVPARRTPIPSELATLYGGIGLSSLQDLFASSRGSGVGATTSTARSAAAAAAAAAAAHDSDLQQGGEPASAVDDELARGFISHWIGSGGAASPPPPAASPLIGLPHDYTELLYDACLQTCPSSGKPIENPVLCLRCGEYLCSGATGPGGPGPAACCEKRVPAVPPDRARTFGPCTMHSLKCGAGKGLFIAVKSCHLVLLNHERGSRRPAPYADVHGEGDPGLKRGCPLFLNQPMLEKLNTIYKCNKVPSTVASDLSNNRRRWIRVPTDLSIFQGVLYTDT